MARVETEKKVARTAAATLELDDTGLTEHEGMRDGEAERTGDSPCLVDKASFDMERHCGETQHRAGGRSFEDNGKDNR